MVNLTINGKQIAVEPGLSVLEAAKQNNILIPSLCYLEGVHQAGACRICVVEIEGVAAPQAACATKLKEGTKAVTQSENLTALRKSNLELLLVQHRRDCAKCLWQGK